MNNPILETIIAERQGHYCHALEVASVYDLESTIEGLIDCYGDQFTDTDYIEFFQSIELYSLEDDKATEEAIYNFDFDQYIRGTI